MGIRWVGARAPADRPGPLRARCQRRERSEVRDGARALIFAAVGLFGCDSAAPLAPSPTARVTVSPSRIDFPLLTVGETVKDGVVVTNPTSVEISIDVIRVDGPDRLSFSTPTSQLTLGSQRSRQIEVTFAPDRVGTFDGELRIFVGVGGSAPIVVPLSGQAVSGAPCEDRDADGYDAECVGADDCDDNRPDVHPGAPEVCNGRDDDCNRLIDDGITEMVFADRDGDGWGDGPAVSMPSCPLPAAYVPRNGDCDDDNDEVHPDAPEVCNGRDDNCDRNVDEGVLPREWYADADLDGFGDANTSSTACAAPPGFVADATDCDDTLREVFPNAPELCNGRDDDCDRDVDEGLPILTSYRDADLDLFGDATTSTTSCRVPPGYVAMPGDCNDAEPTANPNGTEVCAGGIDEDCDTLVDGDDPDCQCTTQDDCGLNSNRLACPRIGVPGLTCEPLCRNPSDCAAGDACRPLPGSSGLGFCATGGPVAEGSACTTTAECATGLCFDGTCRRICQSQADCAGGNVCGIGLYDTSELGGAAQTRETMVCQPLLSRQPIGGSCQIDATNADSGLCATTHCDMLAWAAGAATTPPCAQLCAGSGDCGPSQVCGLVFHGFAENPPILSTGEASGRYFEGVLGCHRPYFFDGFSWSNVPPGNLAIGAPCTSQTRFNCRSHQCAQFAPIANRCTDFCDDDADCVSPSTPNWRCQVGELSLTGVFLQSFGIADITKFTLVGICAP